MAKTRAQRKAERRKKEERRERRAQQRAAEASDEGPAQHDTQAPISGDVAEAEAVIETGARTEDYGEHTVEPEAYEQPQAAVPGVTPAPVAPPPPTPEPEPEPPAPSRADVGRLEPTAEQAVEAPAPAHESRDQKRARRAKEKEERRKARAKQLQKGMPADQPEKRRGRVTGFIASCWAELKRVQWPDRDTLVQASAVTLIFVAVCAAYLGALDAIFNWLVKQIL